MMKKIVLVAISMLLVGCSSSSLSNPPNGFVTAIPNRADSQEGSDNPVQVAPSNPGTSSQLQVILVPSELIVGQNRFAVGLIDSAKGMIHDAAVHFRYFDLTHASAPVVESEADAVRLQTPDGLSTIFAQEREFKRAGAWGVQMQARLADGTSLDKRIGFQVLANSPTLKPGAKVPALVTRTAADVDGDLRKLTSAPHPNIAFYHLSLAQAISNGKPTVLLFATPAFCQTRLCGPSYEIVSNLQKRYGAQANFVHIEVYSGLPNPAANNWQIDPAMSAFGLGTEPWVFLIDKTGTIVYRVEGLVTLDEIDGQLERLMGS